MWDMRWAPGKDRYISLRIANLHPGIPLSCQMAVELSGGPLWEIFWKEKLASRNLNKKATSLKPERNSRNLIGNAERDLL
jgi:hypothetical protein